MSIKSQQLYLKPEEAKFIALAVVAMLTDLQDTSKNKEVQFSTEAKKYIKEMLTAGASLKIKLQKLGMDMTAIPPYQEGDEDAFLTKQS